MMTHDIDITLKKSSQFLISTTNEEKKNEHDLAEESLYSREIFFRRKKSRKMCG